MMTIILAAIVGLIVLFLWFAHCVAYVVALPFVWIGPHIGGVVLALIVAGIVRDACRR